LLIIFFSY